MKNKFIDKIEIIFELFLLVAAYYFMWVVFYQNELPYPYLGRGKYILMGIYLCINLITIYLCDGYKFFEYKMTDIVLSQFVAIFITNFITYFQLCLISNEMIIISPILLLTVIDFIIVTFCAYIFAELYQYFYKPGKTIMVYSGDNTDLLIKKINARSDKYLIEDKICTDVAFDDIINNLEKYDSVIMNDVPSEIRNDILKYCYKNNKKIYIVPKISDILIQNGDDITLFDTPLKQINNEGIGVVNEIVKRFFDILISLLAIVVLSPIFLVVSILIKLEDGGPVFFKQKRVTKNNREFYILKFRSMIVNAESAAYTLDMRATDNDPRITKVGSFIRKCRIDEIPQLINILKGDMSIVGPRPERIENVVEYSRDIPEFVFRNKVKGGLTGYAQIYGKYNTSPYDKLRLDLMYIENYSLLLDIKLIFSTIRILFKPESTEGFDKIEDNEQK